MTPEERRALAGALTALGDDELVLGHRNAEWTGHAPILEEDIAFANIALDEIGHAAVWYRLAAELLGEDPEKYPDAAAYRRPPAEFRCLRLVERPKGDWAFTTVRQYLFDAAEAIRLEMLARSSHPPLAHAAAKIGVEERYHVRHSRAWVVRLGLGTEESRSRMQAALDDLWPDCGQLFQALPDEPALARAGVLPESRALATQWEGACRAYLAEAGLTVATGVLDPGPGRDRHTAHLAELVAEMQSVVRAEPEAAW